MEKRRVHVWISGRVQGVYFRAFARDAAIREGVTGWVRNLRDGRVEAVFEGDSENVERMLEWCGQGSPYGQVSNVETLEEVFRGDFEGFYITYGR